MKKYWKKMIAPLIVTIFVVMYFVLYFGILIITIPKPWNILLGIIPVILIIVLIYVCYERIKEIRSGEEDDLSKY